MVSVQQWLKVFLIYTIVISCVIPVVCADERHDERYTNYTTSSIILVDSTAAEVCYSIILDFCKPRQFIVRKRKSISNIFSEVGP